MGMDIFEDYDDIATGTFVGPVICEIKKMNYRKLDNDKGTELGNIQLKVIGVTDEFNEGKYGLPVGEMLFHPLYFPSLANADGGRFLKKTWKEFCEAAGIPKDEALAVFDEDQQSEDDDHWAGYNVGVVVGLESYNGKISQRIQAVFDPSEEEEDEPEESVEEDEEEEPAAKKRTPAKDAPLRNSL